MSRLLLLSTLFIALCLVPFNHAYAAPKPSTAGIIIGTATIGGSVVGAAAFGGIGLAVGACSPDSFECMSAPLFAAAGAGIGATAGMFLGAAFSAKAARARPGIVLRNMALTTVGGVTLTAISALISPGLAAVTAIGTIAGLPITAGLTATHQLNKSEPRTVYFYPLLRSDQQGFQLALQF